jgi:hypothetical protein
LVLNLIGCVNGQIKCEFRSLSFGFHILMFGDLFMRDFFIVFRSAFFVKTRDCLRNFVASDSDDVECQVQGEMMDCCESLDYHLSSVVSSYRLIFCRGGGSHHDSQHNSEFPRAEE